MKIQGKRSNKGPRKLIKTLAQSIKLCSEIDRRVLTPRKTVWTLTLPYYPDLESKERKVGTYWAARFVKQLQARDDVEIVDDCFGETPHFSEFDIVLSDNAAEEVSDILEAYREGYRTVLQSIGCIPAQTDFRIGLIEYVKR